MRGAYRAAEKKCKEKNIKNKKIKKKKRDKKAVIISTAAAVAMLVLVATVVMFMMTDACILHDWREATCTEPKTCSKCGKTAGEKLGHSWEEATCTEAKTCSVCREREGEALGHDWQEATCNSLQTCRTCGETTGRYAEHQWSKATCQGPSTCSLCGETTGGYGDHQWESATCQKLATCSLCGETTGSYADHGMGEDALCPVCGKQMGVVLTYDNVQQYLSVKCRDNTIEITPRYSNYRYINVHLVICYIINWNSNVDGEAFIDVSWDGYGSAHVRSEGLGGRKLTVTGIDRVIVGKEAYVIF